MPAADALSALDASFLALESEATPMHMGSIGILEGSPFHDERGRLRIDDLRRRVAGRLHLVPKLRKVVQFPLGAEAPPVWVDDTAFDVAEHVRQAALPAPGDEHQLFELCACLMATPLDRARPLWQIWLVDGVAGGRVALVELLHHAVADGLAGVELTAVLLDTEPRPGPPAPVPAWEPAPGPGRLAAAMAGMGRLRTLSGLAAGSGWRALRHPATAGRSLAGYGAGLAGVIGNPIGRHGSSLNRPIGCDRRVLAVRRELEPLLTAARRTGVTLNDLLLAAVAAGVHDLLSSRSEVMEGRSLRVLVPIGTDHHGDRLLGNRLSAMVVTVPVGAATPADRLLEVAAAARAGKDSGEAVTLDTLFTSLDAWPPVAVAAAARTLHHQPFVNLVVTNVPGPETPLYVLGARILEAVPIIPLGGNLSVGVAALSYAGRLCVGILVDPVTCPDASVLARGIGAALDALAGLDGQVQARPRAG